ncbi:MAG: GHKL domain-containing protein [Desulfobacterales bacterium]|nr:GHKL domain-containing protein [Desulfobacterales bacterium]
MEDINHSSDNEDKGEQKDSDLKKESAHIEKMVILGELLGGIAHEISNPLSFLRSNLVNLNKFLNKIYELLEYYEQVHIPFADKEHIEKKKEEINYAYIKSRIVEIIDISLVGADRMKTILQDIKFFSKPDRDIMEEADINAAIDSTLNIMVNEYKNRITIKKEYGNIPLVKCRIIALNQVFMNLLINACYAIKDKGEIRIRTSVDKSTIKIEINDTGSGIPEYIINHIFDPYFTTKPVGLGTGLGLSISRDIIKRHRGEISVKSKENEGTTFILTIPINP